MVYNNKYMMYRAVYKRRSFFVYEITTGDAGRFEGEKAARRAYRDGIYVFTFEHAFFIYYYRRAAGGNRHIYEYISLDATSGYSSHVCFRDEPVSASSYDTLVPDILNSIKYTGDRRTAG